MKSLFEQMGGTYHEENGYLVPNLTLPDETGHHIGIWGHRHMRYLRQHRKLLYYNLLTSGQLNGYLVDLDKQAEEMFFRLVKQMAEREGITERLKLESTIEWISRMNNIRSRATEIVNEELICN